MTYTTKQGMISQVSQAKDKTRQPRGTEEVKEQWKEPK
jgi:hypothetical protein